MDLTYDPTKINVKESTSVSQYRDHHETQNMRTLYPDVIDHIPPNMSPPIDKSVQVNVFC